MNRRRSRMNRMRRRRLNRMRRRAIRRRRRRSTGRRGRRSRLNRRRRRSRLNRMRRRTIRIRDMEEVKELPSDLVMNILSRLPIRSLLRSRCVCKSWRSSTNEHIFSTLRLNQSLITNNKSSFSDAIILTPQSKQLYYTIFEEQEDTNAIPIFKKIDLSFIPQTQRSRLSIVGVCNGILCLVAYTQIFKSIYIMNPITGQHKYFEIQGGGGGGDDPILKMRLISGIGFDETKQVFKLVSFVWYDNPSSSILNCTKELQILTLGGLGNQTEGSTNNIWRRKMACVPNRLNVFLNGSFYWITAVYNPHNDHIAFFIAKLNLGNGDFGCVVLPRFATAIEELPIFQILTCITLRVLENCLCLVDSLGKEVIDIWIRNNDHGKEVWSKKFSIQTAILAPPIERRLVIPIPIKDNGEHLLLVHNGRVIMYNSAGNTCRFFKIGEDLEEGYNFDAFPIVGSLIRV